MFDIIIIGAGPAGATLARLLPGNKKVLLVEKSKKQKCCGGLIAPDAQKVLAQFDIGIPKSVISDPQLLYVRSIDLETENEQRYQRHYTNINRKDFDGFLMNLLSENIAVLPDSQYVEHQIVDDKVKVKIVKNDEVLQYECKILVGADGANSRVRENIYHDFKKLRKYLAIQGEYSKVNEINHYAVFFDRALTDFYCWLIPKDRTILIGGAFKQETNARASYNRLLEKVKAKYYDLGEEKMVDACYVIRPRIADIKTGEKKVFLIGEAAGLISPSSAEGFSYAYKSAIALKRAIDESESDVKNRYKKEIRKLKTNIFLKNTKAFFMYNHILRNAIFKFKISSLGRG